MNGQSGTNKVVDIPEESVGYFRAGLKKVVLERYSTAKAFANKVDIDQVTLSNIFTGVTQKPRPETLAKMLDELEMDCSDIINAGRPPVTISQGVPVDFSSMTGEEVMESVGEISKSCEASVFALARDRNEKVAMLHRVQAVMNALGDRVKVVGSDMVITYCNKAYRAFKGRGVGETCEDEFCSGHLCVVKEVFRTGKEKSTIAERNGRWLGVNAYPLTSPNGEVKEVVCSTRDITEYHEAAMRGEVKK